MSKVTTPSMQAGTTATAKSSMSRLIVALMINIKTFGNRTYKEFVHNPMGIQPLSLKPQSGISLLTNGP
jgi:hypothetical protein